MRYYLCLFAFLSSWHFLAAQNARIDSLKNVLQSQKEDTSKINTLYEIADEFKSINPDTALYFAKQSLSLGLKLNYLLGIADATLLIGIINGNQGSFNQAIEKCNEALAMYDKIISQNKGADKLYLNNERGLAFNIIGINFNRIGNYPEALKTLFIALKIREGLHDKKGISYTENNIGVTYLLQADYTPALKYFSSSLKTREELGDKSGIVVSYNNIANVYNEMGNNEKALNYFLLALNLCKEIDDKTSLALTYINSGTVLQNQKKYNEALKNYFEGLKIANEIGDREKAAVGNLNIGETYTDLKKWDEASEHIGIGLAIAKEVGSLNWLQLGYLHWSLLDSAKRDFKSAMEHYKLHITYRDSLVNEENTKKLTQEQMQYDFDKKEAESKAEQDKKDALGQKELQKQKLVRDGFIGGFTIVLLFAGVFLVQRNKIMKGKKRSDELLLNILPGEVAEELKAKGRAEPKYFDLVTVMFTDFKNFTKISEKLSPSELVTEIHTCFKAFDAIIGKHNIEKIKTIGDSYMCAGGLPVANTTNAIDVVEAAMEIRQFIQEHLKLRETENKEPFEIRIGVHTGSVVAGIVGVKKFAYDIWGDTVNIASRMESSGEAGKVNISGTTYEIVKDKFNCIHRGKIQAKNKGAIDMYFVESVL